MVRWRRGLTHMPFTHALTGSNPVRATISNCELFAKVVRFI